MTVMWDIIEKFIEIWSKDYTSIKIEKTTAFFGFGTVCKFWTRRLKWLFIVSMFSDIEPWIFRCKFSNFQRVRGPQSCDESFCSGLQTIVVFLSDGPGRFSKIRSETFEQVSSICFVWPFYLNWPKMTSLCGWRR